MINKISFDSETLMNENESKAKINSLGKIMLRGDFQLVTKKQWKEKRKERGN